MVIHKISFYADGIKETNRLHKFTVIDPSFAQDIILSYMAKGFKIRAAWLQQIFEETGETKTFKLELHSYRDLYNEIPAEDREEFRKMKWYFTNTSRN